jgi:hypothetical protein
MVREMSEEEIKQKIKEFEEKLEIPAEARAYMIASVLIDTMSAEQEDFGGKIAEYLQKDVEPWKRTLYRALQHFYSKLRDGADVDFFYVKERKYIEISTKKSMMMVNIDGVKFVRWKGGNPLDLPNVDEFKAKIIQSEIPKEHVPYVIETLLLLFQCLSQSSYLKGCFSTAIDYIHNIDKEQEETQQEQ